MDKKSQGIRIYVAIKHMGNITKSVKEYPILLDHHPLTFRELIEDIVKSCVTAYKERANNAKIPSPLTDEQWQEMQQIGKFAFGVHYNETAVDYDKAVSTAIESVSDGLVRVFKDGYEITDLDKDLCLTEGDVLTFVRLTMLSGRMW
ncbi:MAG: hypothetical protein IJW40_09865 [Clostridia bacterium]|nr:hypothetical protein [Clostridia bacterium]